jgi:plasmid stabilization system protein ParE
MAYKLIITELADDDTESALLYYGSINSALSDRFYDELDEVYKKLSEAPQYYSFISASKSEVRDVALKSFPYVVVFEIIADSVYVLSVLNTHRRSPEF